MNYTGIVIICPYFTGESLRKIYCEGVVRDIEGMKRFKSESGKKEFLKKCCGTYAYLENCRYAKLIKRKYDLMEEKNERRKTQNPKGKNTIRAEAEKPQKTEKINKSIFKAEQKINL